MVKLAKGLSHIFTESGVAITRIIEYVLAAYLTGYMAQLEFAMLDPEDAHHHGGNVTHHHDDGGNATDLFNHTNTQYCRDM